MKSSVGVLQLSLIFLSCVFLACGIYLTVGGVISDWADMTGVLKSLWNKVTGRGGKGAFPDTLEGFGYHFNEKGELRDQNGGRFQFVVRKDNPDYNQQRYAAIGDVVTEHLYNMMENDLKLERVHVPVDAKQGEPQSCIFRSRNAAVSPKLMLLIHGSAAVRAGQWTRRLIINENINTGSQLPYIRRAVDSGYAVIVMNPNLNKVSVKGKEVEIRGSESPEKHGVYVWQNFVKPAKARSIAVVAHSYGGVVACAIAQDFMRDWQRRVFSVVFTDSVHVNRKYAPLWNQAVTDFMKQRAVNFVSSDAALNTQLKPQFKESCLEVSAGTPEHERTSHSCINSAFPFIATNYAEWVNNGTVTFRYFLGQPLKFKSEL